MKLLPVEEFHAAASTLVLPCCMYLELMEHFNLGQVNVKTKVADRIVVVTTSSIVKLDNKYKVMKTISLEKVSNPSQEG